MHTYHVTLPLLLLADSVLAEDVIVCHVPKCKLASFLAYDLPSGVKVSALDPVDVTTRHSPCETR